MHKYTLNALIVYYSMYAYNRRYMLNTLIIVHTNTLLIHSMYATQSMLRYTLNKLIVRTNTLLIHSLYST